MQSNQMSIFNFSTLKIAAVCLGVYILKKIFFPKRKPEPVFYSGISFDDYDYNYDNNYDYNYDYDYDYDYDYNSVEQNYDASLSSSHYLDTYAEADIFNRPPLRNLEPSTRNRKNKKSNRTATYNSDRYLESRPTDLQSIPQSTDFEQRKANRRSKKNRKRSTKSTISCTICMTKIYRDLRCLTCCHKFHGKCINQWFLHNYEHLCPICRTKNYS